MMTVIILTALPSCHRRTEEPQEEAYREYFTSTYESIKKFHIAMPIHLPCLRQFGLYPVGAIERRLNDVAHERVELIEC